MPAPSGPGSSATRSPSPAARRTRRPSVTDRRNRRSLNGTVVLHVPASVVKAKAAPYLSHGKPACRNPMVNDTDYNIVGRFGAEYRGIVQYYLLAGDVFRLHRLRWVMETSMLKTLAGKHRSSVSKMAARHRAKVATPHGPRTDSRPGRARGQETTGRMVRRHPAQTAEERRSSPTVSHRAGLPHKQLITRLLRGRCELCGRTETSRSTTSGSSPTSAGPASRNPPGPGHGQYPPQIPRGLRRLPRPDPRAPCHTAHAVDHWRAGYPETGTSGSEGGRAEKDQHTGTSPPGRPYPHPGRRMGLRQSLPHRNRAPRPLARLGSTPTAITADKTRAAATRTASRVLNLSGQYS